MMNNGPLVIDIYFQFLPTWAQKAIYQIALDITRKFIGDDYVIVYTYPSFISIEFMKVPWDNCNQDTIYWERTILRKSLPSFADSQQLNDFIVSFKKKNIEIKIEGNNYSLFNIYKSLSAFTEDLVKAILNHRGNYVKSIVDYRMNQYIVPRPVEAYGYRLSGEKTTRIICGSPFNFWNYYYCPMDQLMILQDRVNNTIKDLEVLCKENRVSINIQSKTVNNSKIGALTPLEQSLEIITDLVLMHYNCKPLIGKFKEKYLSLPVDIIASSLKEHNNSYLAYGEDGVVHNMFVFFIDFNPKQNLNVILQGYEDTVNIRLEEANHYLNEDIAKSIDNWRSSLDNIMFFENKVSMSHKSREVIAILKILLSDNPNIETSFPLDQLQDYLMDLNTKIVQEFNNLQGYMSYFILKDSIREEAGKCLLSYYKNDHSNPISLLLRISNNLYDVLMTIGLGGRVTSTADPYNLKSPTDQALEHIIHLKINLDLDHIIYSLGKNYDFKMSKDFIYQRWFNKLSNQYGNGGEELSNTYKIGYHWWHQISIKKRIIANENWMKLRMRLKGFEKKTMEKNIGTDDDLISKVQIEEPWLYSLVNLINSSNDYGSLEHILEDNIDKLNNYLDTNRIQDKESRQYLISLIINNKMIKNL